MKKKKDLDRKQQLKRTQDIFDSVNEMAKEKDITLDNMLGILLSRCDYRNYFQLGNNIFRDEGIGRRPSVRFFLMNLFLHLMASEGRPRHPLYP